MIKIYEYNNCGTCRKALKYLDGKGIAYEKVPIREKPPTKEELRRMLGYVGSVRKLFNTSGGDYCKYSLTTLSLVVCHFTARSQLL